jgi:hypothetical protein
MTRLRALRTLLASVLASAFATPASAGQCLLPQIEGPWIDNGAGSTRDVELAVQNEAVVLGQPTLIDPQVTARFTDARHHCPHPDSNGKPVPFTEEFIGTMVFEPKLGPNGEWHIEGQLRVCLFDKQTLKTIRLGWADLHLTTVEDTRLDGYYYEADHTRRDIALTRARTTNPPPAKHCKSGDPPDDDAVRRMNESMRQFIENERAKVHGNH